MTRHYPKLLNYLLVFLLAWAPVAPIMAAHGTSMPDSFETCHNPAEQVGMLRQGADSPAMDCDQCQLDQVCDNDCCSDLLCASTVAALVDMSASILPDALKHFKTISSSAVPLPLFYGPYRPPRA